MVYQLNINPMSNDIHTYLSIPSVHTYDTYVCRYIRIRYNPAPSRHSW